MSSKRKVYLEQRNPVEEVNYLLEQLRQQEPYKRRKNQIEQLRQIEQLKYLQGVLREQQEEEKYNELSDIYSESSGSYPPSSIAENNQYMSSNELFQQMKKGLEDHNDYDKAIRKRKVRSIQGSPRGSPSHENLSAYELSNKIKETRPAIEIEYNPSSISRATTPNPLYKGGTSKRKIKGKKYTKRRKPNKKKSIRKKYRKRGKSTRKK